MMFRGLLLILLVSVFVSADYGPPRPYGKKRRGPKIIIKEAGPSVQYRWVGYTYHKPLFVPKPYLIHKWHPYMDPMYKASWVPHKDSHSSGKHHGQVHSHKGSIPHGFGPPKHASLTSGYGLPSAGHGVPSSGYGLPSGPSTGYGPPSGGHSSKGSPVKGFGPPKPHAPHVPVVPKQPSKPVKGQKPGFPGIDPHHIVSEEVEDSKEPQDGYIDTLPDESVELSKGGPVSEHAVFFPNSIQTTGKHANSQSPSFAVGSSFQGPHGPGQGPVAPLVHIPVSDPLPLESEGGIGLNSIRGGVGGESSYTQIKRETR